MIFQKTNRQGDNYYIKSKLTKKGNTSYYMTKKLDDDCLKTLPKGYEVFEKPDSSVLYIRKVKPSLYTQKELNFIRKELKKNKNIIEFRLDVQGGNIRIYVAEKEDNNRLFELWEKPFFSQLKIDGMRKQFMRFEEKMRVKKLKIDGYEFQRYRYRGRIDDWIWIDGGDDLEALAKQNLCYLGKESYFEL